MKNQIKKLIYTVKIFVNYKFWRCF